jgi:hypothetical protein
MSALTSLLVRDRIVPVSKIEEALQHQVLVGGDIETILLEMNAVAEDVLSAYRAALYGLLPATREEVMKATRETLRRVPRELARGAGFVPLFIEGRTLVVAAAEPPRDELARQIAGQLGCELAVRIVTQPRLSAGLSHHYGYELDARLRKLTEALRKRDPGVIPYVRPPTPSMKPLTTEGSGPNPFGDNAPDTLDHQLLAPIADPSAAAFKLSEPALRDDYDARPLKVLDQEAVNGVLGEPREDSASGLWAAESGRERVRAASSIPPATVSAQIARAVRGPISRERVLSLLSEAHQRDDVLFVLMRYTQQFFDFVAVLSVGKEGARGRMAHGGSLAPELMEQVLLPLHGTGLAAVASRDKRPVLGDLSASDDERAAAALLGRPSGRPGLMIPLVLGARTVLLVYAEREGEGVALEDAEPLTAVSKAVADALRRLIVESKALKRSQSGHPKAEEPSARADEPPPPSVPAPTIHVTGVTGERDSGPGSGGAAEPVIAQAIEPAEPPVDVRLQAVDLESMTRVPTRERRRETMPLHSAMAVAEEPHREARETPRVRMFGVPRSAPPPPVRESVPPKSSSAGSYSFVGNRGEEKVRTSRSAMRSRPPLGLVEAPSSAESQESKPVETKRAPERAHSETPNERKQAPSEPAAEGASARRVSRPSLEAVAPSVIIDMGDQVLELVEALEKREPQAEPPEIAELLKVGEVALPVLMQHFPGPLWFEREKHKRRPRGRDVSAVARAIVAFGDAAAPYLASLLGSGDERVYYALMVACEIVHPDLIDAVARHALGSDDELRVLALEVLRNYAGLPQFSAVLRAISDLSARAGKDPRRQRLAVEALGELRDQRSLQALLPRLSDRSEPVVQAAHRALVTLTGQDFGLAQKKWESWADQWGSAHRVEWLIESLMHSEESVRVLSGEELKQLTQQYFGYHPALPKRDRELAQRKYREWWQKEGREAFGVSEE